MLLVNYLNFLKKNNNKKKYCEAFKTSEIFLNLLPESHVK